MHKINSGEITENEWTSPKGNFGSADTELSIALGLDLTASDTKGRHPFDVTICRVRPGQAICPYHAHAAQWEFYHVVSGSGQVRDVSGLTPIGPGDAFIFRPGETHQVRNDTAADLVLYIVADNPTADACYYPDSQKWLVRSPMGDPVIRSSPLDYLDGEE